MPFTIIFLVFLFYLTYFFKTLAFRKSFLFMQMVYHDTSKIFVWIKSCYMTYDFSVTIYHICIFYDNPQYLCKLACAQFCINQIQRWIPFLKHYALECTNMFLILEVFSYSKTSSLLEINIIYKMHCLTLYGKTDMRNQHKP